MSKLRAFPPLDSARLEDEFVVFCEVHPYHMAYVVLEIAAGPAGGEGPVRFAAKDSDDPLTLSVDDAQVLVYGSLKWDGCADMTIGVGDDFQLHFCGRNSALILRRVVERLYDIAAEYMEKFDGGLGS